MARLELFLLGTPRLERDGVPLQFDTRKILALVAYLAMSGSGTEARSLSRESVVALLWPDLEPSRARAVLRRNLSLLRRALGGEWLVVNRQTIGTDPDTDCWLDVDQFLHLAHAWQTHDHPQEQVCPRCLEALAEATALYRGDFLEGFSLRDSVAFDDWQFFQAEELRRGLASVLERLVRGQSARGNPEAALPFARQWLALDPLHEPAHQHLMQLYARTGQRSAALRQYQECVRVLDEEFGLPPSAETAALHEQIRTAPPTGEGFLGPSGLSESTEIPIRATPPRHNLPAQTSPIVGRQEELAEVSARLQDPACRLLTLLGPGGIGKTRLALRLAADMVDTESSTFEHGVFFVPLAPIQASDGVVPAVAEALGFSFHTDAESSARAAPRQQLLSYLGRKQLLLVMDNYEHLLVDGIPRDGGDSDSDVEFLTDVLSTAEGVKVLVTSRISLNVQGEHLYHLAGLRVPEATVPAPADPRQVVSGYAAVELFVQGAQQARPGFELRAQDWAHIAHICRLVQGMPLGILLAAAWVGVLSPREIATEIRQTLDFLETDLRDVPARQRSIRAAFDHSWRLLDAREQEIFQGLSVFRGGFTREAALEVAGASLRDLMSLVNKSLLDASSRGRYELHELLRQYAANQLDLAPEQAHAVRDRHCAYYSASLERWAGELKGARQREALDQMDLEIENGRAAWYWAVAQGQVTRLVEGADGLWIYHDWRLRYEEGEAAYRAAATALMTLDSHDARRLRAKCLILWSSFQLDLAWKNRSSKTLERGLNLLRELEMSGQDARHERALAAYHKGRFQRYYCPDPLEAKQEYARSAALYEAVGDRWGQARALAHLGWMAEQVGHLTEARALCQASLGIRQELGDLRGMAEAQLNLGIISWVQGHLDEALGLLHESLGIFGAQDDWIRIAQTMKSLGELHVRRGRYDDGLALMESSIAVFDELTYAFGVSGVLPFVAEVKAHLGQFAEARSYAEQGAERAGQANHRWGVGFSLFVNGLAALAEGACSEALSLFQQAAAAFGEVRHQENRGWVLGPCGLAALAVGDTVAARQHIKEALQIGAELQTLMPVLYALPAAARLLICEGAEERAVEVYACASRYEFVSNSRWFHDLVGEAISSASAQLPAEVVAEAQAKGQAKNWDVMAVDLLAEL
jgi:predicted ATPase/DNA-binding SARP family transcriptional activator